MADVRIIEEPLKGSQTLENFTSAEDAELLKFYESTKPKICIVGCGGSGSNTINRMADIGVTGATRIALNTDAQHLLKIRADKRLLIGKKTTKGVGAGSNPEVGEAAAEEQKEEIKAAISDASLVFVTCGLGGGTGTGSAPIVAKIAKELGALVIGVVTLPFTSEGYKRRENALRGLEKLKKNVDTLIIIPNDKLLAIVPDLPLDTAFRMSDEVLSRAVKGIAELVTVPGLINLDLADLRTILKEGGYAMIGLGESRIDAPYEERALIAVQTALASPLLDVDISTTNRALINVTGGEDMTLREAEVIAAEVARRIHAEAHIIWGARVEKALKRSTISTLVVLTGAKVPEYSMYESGGNGKDNNGELNLDDLDTTF
jgi:cell division protein FtsZ